MAFILIFLFIFSLIPVVGAFSVYKSEIPTTHKIISIVVIFSVFMIFSIINEAKKPAPVDENTINILEFERNFYNEKLFNSEFKIDLPLLNDTLEWIESSLEENQLDESNTLLFGILIGEPMNGKSFALQEYTKFLHINNIPSIYIDIKDLNSNIINLLAYLQITNLKILEGAIDRLNKDGNIPCLIVDNIHNAFSYSGNDYDITACQICDYLKSLYDTRKINILMATNRYDIVSKINSNEDYMLRLRILYMKSRKPHNLEVYLLTKINEIINQPNKKFTKENIHSMLKTLGFSWDLLNDYIKYNQRYTNVTDFIQKSLLEKKKYYIPNENVKQVVNAMLSCIQLLDKKSYNFRQWVSYGKLKKYLGKDAIGKLDDALKAKTIILDQGKYKFPTQSVINLVVSE